MKSKEEQKTRRVSTRMTQEQFVCIAEKAEKRNMSVSAFMVDSAAHNDNQMTLSQLIRIQNLANLVSAKCEKSNPETAVEIQKEVEALWSLLK